MAKLGVLFFVLCGLVLHGWGAMVSIDLSSESFKMALFAKKLDIVLNEASQRKNPVTLAFYRGDFFVGNPAETLATRAPSNVMRYFAQLLGRSPNDPTLNHEVLRDFYPYTLEQDSERDRFKIKHPDLDDVWLTPEDLVSLILSNAMEIVEKSVGLTSASVVITVPPYYAQQHRVALLNAAKLAGLENVVLVNENVAVSTMYGIERQFGNASNVLFIDMGATKTTATVTQYSTKTKGTKNSTSAMITGTAWDANLGGRDFTERLAKHFAAEFSKQQGKDYLQNAKVMARFRKEANKAKEILSANTVTQVAVESIDGDSDFHTTITREAFEAMCSDLFPRVTDVVQRALAQTGLLASDLEAIEIVGGGLRIPRVQQELQEAMGRSPDRHMNGDESAVFGAAYYGALEAGSLRGRDFKIKSVFPFPIEVSVTSDNKDVDRENDLFTSSKFGAKRSINFHTNENFTIALRYKESDALPPATTRALGTYFVTVPSVEQYNHTGEGHVKASFHLTVSGLAIPDRIESELNILKEVKVPVKKIKENQAPEEDEKTPEKLIVDDEEEDLLEDEATMEKPEAGDSEPSFEEPAATKNSADENSESEDEPSQQFEDASSDEEYEIQTKKTKKTVLCKWTQVEGVDYPEELFQTSKKFLTNLKEQVKEKRDREHAMNSLEAYIYEWKTKLEEDTQVGKFSSEQQREELLTQLNSAQEWLEYDASAETTTKEFQEKLEGLKKLSAPIEFRVAEYNNLPKTMSRVFDLWNRTKTELAVFPILYEAEEAATNLLAAIKAAELEIMEKGKQQADQLETAPFEDPIITSSEIIAKWSELDKKFQRLKRIPKKKPILPDLPEPANEDVDEEDDPPQPDSQNPADNSAEDQNQDQEYLNDEL